MELLKEKEENRKVLREWGSSQKSENYFSSFCILHVGRGGVLSYFEPVPKITILHPDFVFDFDQDCVLV